jgi:hypothetical protein
MGVVNVNRQVAGCELQFPVRGDRAVAASSRARVTIPVLAGAPTGTVSLITLDPSQSQWTERGNGAFGIRDPRLLRC